MIKKESSNDLRLRRHARIRKNISGNSEMPRLKQVLQALPLNLKMAVMQKVPN